MNSKVTLEPLTVAHAELMFEVLSDPTIYEFLDYGPPESVEALRATYYKLESRKSPDETQDWLNWAVRDDTGRLVGDVQATVYPSRDAWIAFVIARAHWGKGFARQATQQMFDILQTEFAVKRLLATADEKNVRSLQLLRRLGFTVASVEERDRHDVSPTDILMARELQPPPRISFRRLTTADFSMVHDWLQRPHVAQWWGPSRSYARVREVFLQHTAADSTTRGYIALLGDEPIGFIQSYVVLGSGDGWWEDETDPGARGIDQFVADADRLDTGIGTEMIRAFCDELFADSAVTQVQTDPAPDNARAIRSYEKAGFVRSREVDTPDGRALLMLRKR